MCITERVRSSWRHAALAMFVFTAGMGGVRAADVSLSATGGNGKIDLSWTVNGNLRGVQVMRDTDSNPLGRQRVATLGGGARNYADNTVTNGRQYWYWIKYTDTNRATGNSNSAHVTAGTAPTPEPNPGNDPIAGYSQCSGEGETCTFTGTVDIAYGANGKFNFLRNQSGGSVACNNGTFGDPIYGTVKACYVKQVLTPEPTVAVTGVTVTPASAALSVGSTSSLTATVQPSNASNKSVSWSSSNTGVATVNASGVVSGVSAGNANVTVTTADGGRTASSSVKVLATPAPTQPPSGAAQCDTYTWPTYKPNLNYDFRQDFANIDPSKFKVFEGCDKSQIAGVKTSGWYAFIWGKNRNPAITDADIDRVLKDLNEDMAFAREKMGWPPGRLPQEGYYNNVYLYGSGLCTDNASNTEKGGWQSDVGGYPIVLLSYYPVITPSERGGITHEAIHTLLATMGNKAAWFNEGGNTWLQMNMEAARTGGYGVGFLDGAPFLAPHMPIENYSGWLQDGSFGGPNAEGVNQYRNGQQISTWRAYLGGNQYNSAFAHFLAVHVSPGANAWIWKKGTENGILASLAGGLGVEQTQHLIMEYRARQAMVDFGPWSDAFKAPINERWGQTVGAERIDGGILQEPAPYRLSFYAEASKQGDTLVPSTETLPGWSGANQIPLKVSGNKVRVNFKPIGRNMRLQLAYRAQDGSAVYSQPVTSGEACLNLDKAPKDGSVVAVISNVDHLYQGEETRKRKHDYRIQLLEGVSGTASTTEKHYQ